MNFTDHGKLKGQHAFLGASKYHWLGYSPEKIAESYRSYLAVQKGTVLHAFAATCITLNQRLPRSSKTLNAYVNDAIGFRLKPEVTLYYSDNCFGTADAIGFRNNELRIHDLKTGRIPAHMEQLLIYAALFCLEYRYKPSEIHTELRIYQNDDVEVYEPTPEELMDICNKIIEADKIVEQLKEMEG